jgi:hypothetical protein
MTERTDYAAERGQADAARAAFNNEVERKARWLAATLTEKIAQGRLDPGVAVGALMVASVGVGIALRQDLTLEIVRHGKPTSGMHYLVATMRAAAVVLQPKALFIQKKVP